MDATIEKLLPLIGDKELGAKSEAMEMILAMGFDSVCPFLERAVRDDHDANLRNGAMEIFVSFGRQATPNLLQLLQDGNEEVRNFSTVMLGDIGSREAVPALIRALRDPDANVRHGAAEALGKIGDRNAFLPLLALLKEDFWLQYPAIVALGEMRDKKAVPRLLDLLDNKMLTVPVVAALGKIGDLRALYLLCTTLNTSEDSATSCLIAEAIVSICRANEALCPQEILEQMVHLREVIHRKGIINLKQALTKGAGKDIGKEQISAVITLLGWLKESTVVPDYLSLLESSDYLDPLEDALFAMGNEAVPYLVEALSLPSINVKVTAARLLGQIGNKTDKIKIIPLLRDPSEQVQLECLEALKGITDDEMLATLLEMVEFGSDEISLRACEVLGLFPFPGYRHVVWKFITSPDARVRMRAATLIGSGNADVSYDMLCRLANDADAVVRKQTVRLLALKKHPEALKLLVMALKDVDEEVQVASVTALAEYGELAPVDELLGLLATCSENLAYAIVESIGKIGAHRGGQALFEYLCTHPVSQRMELLLVETLGKLCYKQASALLATYLKHHDPDFRRLAVQMLAAMPSQGLLSAAETACMDSHWSVRIAALHALQDIDHEKAFPAIVAALNDDDYMVRQNAVASLERSLPALAIPVLVEQLPDDEIGYFASLALLKIGRKGLAPLHRIMVGRYAVETRVRVIDIVGKIGSRRSVGPLMKLLDDPAQSVRLAALDALVNCFDGTVLGKLSRLKMYDASNEVRERARLTFKALTMEKFA